MLTLDQGRLSTQTRRSSLSEADAEDRTVEAVTLCLDRMPSDIERSRGGQLGNARLPF
jgi:hypothetical protein